MGLDGLGARDDDRTGAVGDARGVAGRDGAVLLEERLEPAQRLGGGARPGVLVRVERHHALSQQCNSKAQKEESTVQNPGEGPKKKERDRRQKEESPTGGREGGVEGTGGSAPNPRRVRD